MDGRCDSYCHLLKHLRINWLFPPFRLRYNFDRKKTFAKSTSTIITGIRPPNAQRYKGQPLHVRVEKVT
jgi:hypothetical protein